VVRADRETVCFGERHTGRDKILLRIFPPRQQIFGGGRGCHNQTPPTGRYERIKAELIRRLSFSEEQRVRQILMHEEMGDRRPTQFLLQLRTLAGPSVPFDILRNFWTNRLPPKIQAIIATQAQVSLDDVAQLADKITEVTCPPCVARVSSSGDDNTLTARIDELARQVAALSTNPPRPCSPSQTRRHARRSPRPAGRSSAPDT